MITAPQARPAVRAVRRVRRPAGVASAARRRPVLAARPAVDTPADPVDVPDSISRGAISAAAPAQPAATTTVDAAAISRAPVAGSIDLFRSLPGFQVSGYGQGALANGISLRGYTDNTHGRDIAYSIDGVPLNEVSSIHTPNYADLAILIPETIKSISVVRGPFSVEQGDSNLGGAIDIVTKESEPFASASLSGGTQGTIRGVGTYSTTQGAWIPFIACEGFRTDGYRANSFIERYNAFNKITTTLPDGATLSVRAQAYGTRFGAPGYLGRDAVIAGRVSERSAVNPTDGGSKEQQNVVANYSSGARDQELKGTLFVTHDETIRYFDPNRGQRVQSGDRTTVGGKISKSWTGSFADAVPVQLLLGGNWRSDVLETFQQLTMARQPTAPRSIDVGLTQHNIAAFAQVQIKPVTWLKITGGGRFDQFVYDIDNRLTGAVASPARAVSNPKLGIAVTPAHWLELFANYGQGFRSPDAPLELLINPMVQPFKITSAEAGAQLNVGRLHVLASYWTTGSQNESFQPAPGLPVTFLGKARRDGVDVDGRVVVVQDRGSMVAVFANYSGVRARLIDAAPSTVVPYVPDYVANLGVDLSMATLDAHRLSGSAYVTFVGRKNLTQDGLITSRPYSRATAKLAYSWPQGWTAFTQAIWYPGERFSEIAINFGTPTGASSADIVTSPQPRFVALAGLSYRFPTGPLPTASLIVK